MDRYAVGNRVVVMHNAEGGALVATYRLIPWEALQDPRTAGDIFRQEVVRSIHRLEEGQLPSAHFLLSFVC